MIKESEKTLIRLGDREKIVLVTQSVSLWGVGVDVTINEWPRQRFRCCPCGNHGITGGFVRKSFL